MIDRLVAWLEQSGLDLSSKEIADALWLAMQMGMPEPMSSVTVTEEPAEVVPSPQITTIEANETAAPSPAPDVSFSAFPSDAISRPSQEIAASEGLPFQAPAATALQNALELGRSLRPLMRKVPSSRELILDEAATVDRIVEQDIWQPVLVPAPERWLDLELVVEASPLSQVWHQTIADFQHKVLERQGAFRNVRAWTLQNNGQNRPQIATRNVGESSPRLAKPAELVHPSGRRCVMLLSDCRSELWNQKPSLNSPESFEPGQPNIYHWLSYWANHGPLLLVQLLPEWLWERSRLKFGFEAQISSLSPGAANAQLEVQGLSQRSRDRAGLPNALKILVTTLDAEVLLRCSEVIAGSGMVQAPGVIFNLARLPLLIERSQDFPTPESSPVTESEEAERLVDVFLANASPMAQELAGMMAAVPVSLPVVHLLQAKLLQHSTPVHVAEVYMSPLLEEQGINEATQQPIYDFKPGVRRVLTRSMLRYTSERVLDTLTQAIAEKLGVSISSFAAFLSPKKEWLEADRTIARFAEILPEVLRNLGEDYAILADQAEAMEALRDRLERLEGGQAEFPSLKLLEFETVQIIAFDTVPNLPSFQTEEVEVVTIGFEAASPFADFGDELQPFEFEVATLEYRTIQRRSGFFRNLFGQSEPQSEWIIQRQKRQAYQWIEPLGNRLQLEMVAIPSGRFLMGSPEGEEGRSASESPQHEVTVNQFLMGRYPVTQAQWRFVAGLPQINRELDPDPSDFKGDTLPVEQISWYEAVEFCDRLSQHTGREYRLPTEAEWEYACRAGTMTPFHFGETISADLANHDATGVYGGGIKSQYRKKTTPVNSFNAANAFGLSEMHGNVWEWCLDHWHGNYEGAPTDGSAWLEEGESDRYRVLRGGSWIGDPGYCRSASRYDDYPDDRRYFIGFRVVCVLPRILQ